VSELDLARVHQLLSELGERLAARGIEGEIYIVGGVAMMLAYNRSRTTADIDAVGAPQAEIDREVRAMAREYRDLPDDWLNARVLPLLPRGVDADRLQVLGGPGLTVNVASPRWLLAMKARAARGVRDFEDLWVLCQLLELRSVNEVWQICEQVWGGGMIRDEVVAQVSAELRTRGLT